MPAPDRIPTTIVCGSLGVGKTTALLSVLARRPPSEGRWAVLVNEFGRVGIDAARLADGGGPQDLEIREIAGGCICCTATLPLRVALTRLVREVRPERLLIEPSGLAHPATLVDAVRAPGLREALALRATIGLVDPRKDAFPADVLGTADVLVGTFADRCTPADLARFEAQAAALDPAPLVVATVAHGALDLAWLDLPLDAAPRATLRFLVPAGPSGAELGFTWSPERRFDLGRLQEVLQMLVRPGPLLPDGVLRLKGLVHTDRGVLAVDASADEIRFQPSGWRRDSRIAVITSAPAPDPDAVEAALEAAFAR